MSAKPRLIEAMRAACGCIPKSTTDWLALAQTHDALRDAFRALYGRRSPSVQRLGTDLSKLAGVAFGDLRLVSIYSAHKKAARYAVETAAESAAREWKEHDREEREQIIRAEKEQRAISRALKKVAEKEAKEREKVELAHIAKMKIEVVQPAPEIGYSAGAEPRVKYGPDSRAVAADPELPPPARQSPSKLTGGKLLRKEFRSDKTVEFWELPNGSIVENWVTLPSAVGWQPAGLHGRPTRAQLAARHHQREVPANIPPPSAPGLGLPGLAGPGGLRVRNTDGMRDGWRHGGANWTQKL